MNRPACCARDRPQSRHGGRRPQGPQLTEEGCASPRPVFRPGADRREVQRKQIKKPRFSLSRMDSGRWHLVGAVLYVIHLDIPLSQLP